ncbi:iron-containing redox enzyme family protein [Streptomyces sp. TRM 70361]|uniref:iron-containing redox enzyme family protein n=1 Tax=Streptomyces sp. TRM 70361 TaxID=3116553 RepID=UPI002E7BA062|nr:iron-containing redox enzyme family protein [Streptomyces sp. TRM 70361]MEE1942078.1 iron-containing redox enzyme family protein [Streptomyces sp. TRM 70361]
MTGALTSADTAALPGARGALSAAVLDALAAPPPAPGAPGAPGAPTGPAGFPSVQDPAVADADPYGDDLQLALYLCYELHYRGFAGVSPDWEWDPDLLRLRAALERVFLAALRRDTGSGASSDSDVAAALDPLLVQPAEGGGVSDFLLREGEWWQLREYFAHRSVYHLKEADPHAFAIPRLDGQAKASLVAVEYDEYGGGRGERVHARLFADLLAGAGLDPSYLGYLDRVPAPALATVNLMSLCGLHRSLRGALVGHFAAAEISTAPSARKMARALERLGADERCVLFFTEHIEADAVHEQVMRRDVIGDLLAREPHLAADVVFGIRATELLEERLAEHLLGAWRGGDSSLRRPLDAPSAG